MSALLAWLAGIVVAGWGVMHIMPSKKVVAGYEPLTDENRWILLMEWVAEGIAYIFVGVLLAAATVRGAHGNEVTVTVYAVSAGMLVVMAVWTVLTGARASNVMFKICPVVLTSAAAMLLAAIVL